MANYKQASAALGFFGKAINYLSRAGRAVGQAGKWSWKSSGAASKLAGKSLSLSGPSKNVISLSDDFIAHTASLSDDLANVLNHAAKDPKKAEEIVNVVKLTGFATAKKGAPASEVIKNISTQLQRNAKPVKSFFITFKDETAKILATASPAEKKIIANVIADADKIIAKNGIKGVGVVTKQGDKIPNELTQVINRLQTISPKSSSKILRELTKASKASKRNTEFLGLLQSKNVVGIGNQNLYAGLIKSFNNLEFVSAAHAFNLKNVAGGITAISTILFGASLAAGGLVGENVKLIKKIQEIISKIKEELQEIPIQDEISGQAWKKERDRLIKSLSVLDAVNVAAYENADVKNITEEELIKIITGLTDLSNRFEVIGKVFEEIVYSKALQAIYEKGGEGAAQSVSGYVDTISGGIFGNISSFKKVQELARNGLQALSESGEKISKSSEELHNKLQQEEKQEEPVSVTADFIMQQFIVTGEMLEQASSYRDVDIIKSKLNKRAGAAAVAGVVGKVLFYITLGADAINVVVKFYSRLSDDYDKISKNVKTMLAYLQDFNSFDTNSDKAIEFKNNNDKLMKALSSNLEFLEKNIKSIDQIVEAQEPEKIAEMIVDKDKVNNIKAALNNIGIIYETFMSEQWKNSYTEHSKSWFQSILSGAEFATLFSGEGTFSAYSRFIYTAKNGVSMIANANLQIENVMNLNQKIKEKAEETS